jgi:hypothetical protein
VSRRGPSKAEQKAARKRDRAEVRARDSADWDDHMVLEPAELRSLLEHLRGELEAVPCDHTHRITRSWASDRGAGWERVRESLLHFGGGCDCEVLANVDPASRVDTWARY